MKTKEILVNGVYFVMNDGTFVPVTSEEVPSKEQIELIGVAHDGHYFAIPLDWDVYGHRSLVDKDCSRNEKFCKREMEALCDWDFVSATKHLQEIGLTFELSNGHYLPTLAVLLAMFHNKEAVNSALAMAGAKRIDFGAGVWSSSRCTSNLAWRAYGYLGFFNGDYMCYGYLAVPVSLWEPIF